MGTGIKVRSHVARDLLQSAAVFKHEPPVVWEYVSNELQYIDPGTSPVVKVRLDSRGKRISIMGNGRGMDWKALEDEFFVLHGENVDRKSGQPGRGRFGTGKSAAFGIGDLLRITTVRAGKRSIVELRRSDIERIDSGDPIPVREIEREVPVDEPNGTLVEIEDIHLRSLDQAAVVRYVERHLARWPKNAEVLINNHECEFAEPPIERSHTYEPEGPEKTLLGDIGLVLKVSKSPLPSDLRGVSIFSKGVWHETTLAGCEGKDMAEFIFGELDVPRLDDDDSQPPAFDLSRSMQLNPHNELVKAIYTFIGPRIEDLRKELVSAQKREKETEDAKRLQQEAGKIEQIINDDFERFRKRLQKVKAASDAGGIDVGEKDSCGGGEGEDDFLFGGEESAEVTRADGGAGKAGNGPGSKNGPPRRLNPIVEPDGQGDATGHHEGSTKKQPRRRGGFNIEFHRGGESGDRAEYSAEKRTIYINLEHPQIAAAKQDRSVEDAVFRRLAYEVAFSEYAIALASELDNRGELMDPSEAIFEIRDAANRVARQAASLYI